MTHDELRNQLNISNRALAEGNAKHALEHLTRAFVIAPFDERVHAAFEAIAQRADILANLPDDHYLGAYLVRAHALYRARRITEALTLLAGVAEQLPASGFEVVLTGWLVTLRATGSPLGDDASGQLARLLTMVCRGTIGLHRLRPGERALLEGYGELAREVVACSKDQFARAAAAGVLRRLGHYDDALAATADGHHEMSLIQTGLTLRAMGDGRRAAEVFAAPALDAANDSFKVEQARCWFVIGEFARARAILARLPASDDAEVLRFSEACSAEIAGDRVEVLDRIRRENNAVTLRAPHDATANIFYQQRTDIRPGSSLTIAISGWESPSNRLLAALYATRAADVTKVEYSAASMLLPFDPVSQRRGDGAPLWVVRGGVIVQGPAAPAIELRRAIASVARGNDGIEELWARAAALAATLDVARASEIAAALVHPPIDPDWLETLPEGLFRYQVAGACVLAALPNAWSSTTRALFESLLFGPVDWVSGAAVIALGELAQRDAAVAREALTLLCDVTSDLLPHSCEPRFFPLAHALGCLPGVPKATNDAVAAWYGEHVEQSDNEQATEAPQQRHSDRPPQPSPAKPGWAAFVFIAIALAIVTVIALAR